MDSTEVSSCKSNNDQEHQQEHQEQKQQEQQEQQEQQQPVTLPTKEEETKKKPEIVEKKEDEDEDSTTEKREQPRCIDKVRIVPLMQVCTQSSKPSFANFTVYIRVCKYSYLYITVKNKINNFLKKN